MKDIIEEFFHIWFHVEEGIVPSTYLWSMKMGTQVIWRRHRLKFKRMFAFSAVVSCPLRSVHLVGTFNPDNSPFYKRRNIIQGHALAVATLRVSCSISRGEFFWNSTTKQRASLVNEVMWFFSENRGGMRCKLSEYHLHISPSGGCC